MNNSVKRRQKLSILTDWQESRSVSVSGPRNGPESGWPTAARMAVAAPQTAQDESEGA
jgi:hypothetical protein